MSDSIRGRDNLYRLNEVEFMLSQAPHSVNRESGERQHAIEAKNVALSCSDLKSFAMDGIILKLLKIGIGSAN